jgi:hypothetical protein
MGKNRIVVAVAVMGLLAASTAFAAGSKKIPQTGNVDGDSQASVRLVVIKQGGAPKSVKNVKLRDLASNCTNGEARISLRLFGRAARVDAARKFEKTYSDGKSKVKFEGKVKRDGSGVHASISGTTIKIAGAGRCDVPNIEFTTKR